MDFSKRTIITICLIGAIILLPWFITLPAIAIAIIWSENPYWEGVVLAMFFDFMYLAGFSLKTTMIKGVPLALATTLVLVVFIARSVLKISPNKKLY